MCRGLALGYNRKTGEIICKGLSSHTDTLKKEDNFVKLEIICDDTNKDGYKIVADEQYSKEDKEFFTENGELKKPFYDIIYKWVKENELQIIRWLLVNRTYTEAENNLDQYSCKAENNLDQYSCKAGNNLNQYSCKAGNNLKQSSCKAGNDLKQYSCEAGNDLKQSSCKAGNDLNQYSCKAGNDLNQPFCKAGNDLKQYSCKAGNDLDQSYCKAGKDLDQSSCEAGKTIYNHRCKAKKMTIQYMECGTKKQNDFIKMLSDKAKNNVLYWSDLVKLAMKGYEK
jgi:hypothetical protein